MNNEYLIGREKECEKLSRCMKADSAQLIIVYGRRRVGKTFLINEFFDYSFAFKLTGSFNLSKEDQLKNFVSELERKTGKKYDVPKDWLQAFNLLRSYLEKLSKKKKQVVFLDELPWFDTHKSKFFPAFEWFWNDWASTQRHLIFIVCGSATSWMVDKISNNRGGLFNRQTSRLYLEPFSLRETEQFLNKKGIRWSRYDIAESYMIMGGIPYYLSLLDPELSYTKNIDRLFFEKRSELWDEFDHLYRTLFTSSDNYIKVVKALSEKRNGYTRNEIAYKTGLSTNGKLTKILKNLSDSGFIRASLFYGNKKKETVYQLSDYYTSFYFAFVKDKYGVDQNYWSKAIDNPSRRAWAGLTFEQLCKDHIQQIKNKIGISDVLTEESVWSIRGDEDLGISGAQIDMVIDRRDRVINLCEIKYSVKEYVIDKSYDEDLRNKMDSFVRSTGTNKAVQLVMISTYGVKDNKYSGLIGKQIVLDDLFM
ncbi:MAG: ATP-binding protein [Erysipelotrichaceae bacterium]|nr:ATP-binding protein [Erysipelotrichaceae bacterium]